MHDDSADIPRRPRARLRRDRARRRARRSRRTAPAAAPAARARTPRAPRLKSGASRIPMDNRDMASRVSSPDLIGRGEELRALEDAYARAADGRPAVVLVGGESGIGKSRLV